MVSMLEVLCIGTRISISSGVTMVRKCARLEHASRKMSMDCRYHRSPRELTYDIGRVMTSSMHVQTYPRAHYYCMLVIQCDLV